MMWLAQRPQIASGLGVVSLLAVGICSGACRGASDAYTPTGQLTLVAELRIGEEGRGPEYQFTTISQVVAHGDAVYVVQQGVPEIRVFEGDGRYRQTIGRSGGGPGEFQGSPSIGFLGDTLWAIDADVRRMSLFTASGRVLSTIHLESVPLTLGQNRQFYFPYPKVLVSGGWILGFGGEAGASVVSGEVTARPLLRFPRAGGTADTLGWVSIAHADMVLRTEKRAMLRTQPFSDAPLTVYAPLARRVVIIERYSASDDTPANARVTALEANGDTAWSTLVPYKPVRLEDSVVDSVRTVLQRAHEPRYPSTAIDRALFAPTFRTPITAALAGDDGTFWLLWDDATAPSRVTVIDANGRPHAEVTAPAKIRLKWVSGMTAWGEELDDNDVPTLVRYRLVAAR